MPNVTALCGQLVLILDTATSQGLLVPELWAGPIPTLSTCLVQICHFPFLFPEMRQFLLNSSRRKLTIHSLQAILASCVGEAPLYTPSTLRLLVLRQSYLPTNKMTSQATNNLIRCPLSGGHVTCTSL